MIFMIPWQESPVLALKCFFPLQLLSAGVEHFMGKAGPMVKLVMVHGRSPMVFSLAGRPAKHWVRTVREPPWGESVRESGGIQGGFVQFFGVTILWENFGTRSNTLCIFGILMGYWWDINIYSPMSKKNPAGIVIDEIPGELCRGNLRGFSVRRRSPRARADCNGFPWSSPRSKKGQKWYPLVMTNIAIENGDL